MIENSIADERICYNLFSEIVSANLFRNCQLRSCFYGICIFKICSLFLHLENKIKKVIQIFYRRLNHKKI